MACSSSRNHQHFDTLTIEKSESLFKGEASFLFADVTAGQQMARDREQEVKIKKNSREFSRNENLAGDCWLD